MFFFLYQMSALQKKKVHACWIPGSGINTQGKKQKQTNMKSSFLSEQILILLFNTDWLQTKVSL